ncbi:aspartyl/asparaginyl beta-hydroxylase domain-containing protein [Exilibacterium tricleocarpae]|nr:aspartyl/asparaginyl beta-hydroxylase domain-containing protein [Exilibacterium tricleocarpae]
MNRVGWNSTVENNQSGCHKSDHVAEAEIRKHIKNMNFAPISHYFKPALQQAYRDELTHSQFVLETIANIGNVALAERPALLILIMTDVIRKLTRHESAFFDCGTFPWITDVEKLYPSIVDEVEVALDNSEVIPAFQEIQKEQEEITCDEKWKVVLFKGYGEDIDKNLDLFPKTAQLLNHIPGWTTGMFSILLPGKEIPAHVGPYAGVLRYHLGLKIPDNCGISVRGEVRTWQEGKSLVFDDSFEHFAWNRSGKKRVVLFVDFLRPLPFPLNLLNEWVVLEVMNNSDFIRGLVDNLHKYKALHELLN